MVQSAIRRVDAEPLLVQPDRSWWEFEGLGHKKTCRDLRYRSWGVAGGSEYRPGATQTIYKTCVIKMAQDNSRIWPRLAHALQFARHNKPVEAQTSQSKAEEETLQCTHRSPGRGLGCGTWEPCRNLGIRGRVQSFGLMVGVWVLGCRLQRLGSTV